MGFSVGFSVGFKWGLVVFKWGYVGFKWGLSEIRVCIEIAQVEHGY